MPISRDFKSPFYCNQYYHLVFKCIDGLLLFRNDFNRTFFLERFLFFTKSVFNCQAYCLLDNHVHFIVSVKENKALQQSLAEIPDKVRTIAMKKFLLTPENELLTDELVERQVNRFMVSYANAYNRMHVRQGSLFQFFRRSTINEDAHLQQAIIYVHANAQKHGLIKDYRTYPYTSYNEIITGKSFFVNVAGVLHFFGGTERFIEQHQQQVEYFYSNNWPSSRNEVD
jgi:putative transposase